MNVGAFVCACGADTLDLEAVREGVDDVEVVASSNHLCEDGLPAVAGLVDEYDLDQLVVTAEADRCKQQFQALVEEKELHPDAAEFVPHRELAAWMYDEEPATDVTSRLINARASSFEFEPVSRTVARDAGDHVAVVGDAETASALADTADVTLVANGADYADADVDLTDVTVERGRVVAVDGRFGEFKLVLRSRVTSDCIDCMECVEAGPDGEVTARPVDVAPTADGGEWVRCCPTDAIDLDGVDRRLDVDQVIYPDATRETRGGRVGFYTGQVDAGTIASVEGLLGGVTKPKHLDIEMDVCAAGSSSQEGCTACSDACPHGAVLRPTIDSVEFDEVACQDCGACTSSCPTGAVQLRDPSNERLAREVETLLDDRSDRSGGLLSWGDDDAPVDTPVVAFVCSERAADSLRAYARRNAAGAGVEYPPVLPVQVGCTDTVGEAHVLHALAAGAHGVAVVGCGDACLHSGPDPKARLVERLNQATTDLGLGDRVGFFAPAKADSRGFAAELSSFVDGLDATPVPAGEHQASGVVRDGKPNPAFNTHDWALESVRAILDHVEPERDVIRGLQSFGRMEVSDACNLTPTCTTLCPTDSIQRTTDGDLLFNHEDCVNCGLCEEGCPETAITMRDGLALDLLPERQAGVDDPADAPAEARWTRVYDGEMLDCVRCGTPFTSAGSAQKIQDEVGDLVEGIAGESEHSIFEYCSDCRAKLLFEQGGA